MLYKVVGPGLQALAARKAGDTISMLGPIGQPFVPHPERPRTLLIGGGVGIPPMVFLADRLRDPHRCAVEAAGADGVGSAVSVSHPPLAASWSRECPTAASPACPCSRSGASPAGWPAASDFPGCFDGFVTELADAWLRLSVRRRLAEVEIFACGPTPMLEATARLARRFGVSCQVSLEEFMACAVGGCAGCTVSVQTPEGPR